MISRGCDTRPRSLRSVAAISNDRGNSPGVQRGLDAAQIQFWGHAVELQGRRANDGTVTTMDAQVDCYLFLVTVRQLVRAVEFCRPHGRSEIDKALHEFKHTVPGWLILRDAVEHFDEYERGVGRHQKSGTLPTELSEWFEHDGTSITIQMRPHSLRVADAVVAASQLSARALNAVFS